MRNSRKRRSLRTPFSSLSAIAMSPTTIRFNIFDVRNPVTKRCTSWFDRRQLDQVKPTEYTGCRYDRGLGCCRAVVKNTLFNFYKPCDGSYAGPEVAYSQRHPRARTTLKERSVFVAANLAERERPADTKERFGLFIFCRAIVFCPSFSCPLNTFVLGADDPGAT